MTAIRSQTAPMPSTATAGAMIDFPHERPAAQSRQARERPSVGSVQRRDPFQRASPSVPSPHSCYSAASSVSAFSPAAASAGDNLGKTPKQPDHRAQ